MLLTSAHKDPNSEAASTTSRGDDLRVRRRPAHTACVPARIRESGVGAPVPFRERNSARSGPAQEPCPRRAIRHARLGPAPSPSTGMRRTPQRRRGLDRARACARRRGREGVCMESMSAWTPRRARARRRREGGGGRGGDGMEVKKQRKKKAGK